MSKLIDMTGKRFGKLVVISRYGSTPNKMATWLCKCDCGNETIVQTCHLNAGAIQSCGCLHRERASKANITHGDSRTRLFNEWQHMKKRCYWKNYKAFNLYGGKGITVCDEWRNDYLAFKSWALKNGYSDNLTLDRIDNSKGYYSENCRWTDKFTQSNNRDFVHLVSYHGKTASYEVMCRELNINTGTIRSRMKKKNISFEEAVDLFPPTAPYVNYTLKSKLAHQTSTSTY